MRLNPTKCIFGATSSKFLGYLISQWGIEANPNKVQAVLDMQPPSLVKEVQKLARQVATLSRFLPKSVDKCTEFFKVLKSLKMFQWSDHYQRAFEELE